MHMVSFWKISAWVFLIHLLFYAGFYSINKFLYVNISILIFEFLKKEFVISFLNTCFGRFYTIPDFRSDSFKGIFIQLVCSKIIDIVTRSYQW